MPPNDAPLQASTVPEIKVDGQAQPGLARDLQLLQIEEDVHGLRRLQASFVAIGPREGEQNEQLNWLDGAVLDFGKALVVSMGPSDARATVKDTIRRDRTCTRLPAGVRHRRSRISTPSAKSRVRS